jgi:hypothetical protein
MRESFDWKSADPSRAEAVTPESPIGGAGAAATMAAGSCPPGGLAEVMRWQLTAATMHVGTCAPCQQELLDCGGIMPAGSRRPVRGGQRALRA